MVNQFTSPIPFDSARFITVHNNQPHTTSLQVAECFGKRHDDVLKKIRNLDCSADYHARNFAEMIIDVEIGKGAKRKTPVYEMTKDGFIFLVMGFTGHKAAAIKEAYINAFNMMYEQLRQAESHRTSDVLSILRYSEMLREQEQNMWRAEKQLEDRFYQLERNIESFRQEMNELVHSRRASRDIVNHMLMHGRLSGL